MTLRLELVPQPAAGTDWSIMVPGQQVWDVVAVTGKLNTGGAPPAPCPCTPANVHTACALATTFGPPTGYFTLPLAAFAPGVGPWTVEGIVRGADLNYFGLLLIAQQPAPLVGISNLRIALDSFFGSFIDWADGATFQMAFGSKPCNVTDWAHVAITSDGSGGVTIAAYWEGVLSNSMAPGVYAESAPGESLVGSNVSPSLGGVSFARVSDLAYYHTALSPAQVAAHAALVCTDLTAYRAAVLADGPNAYYPMDDGVGSPVAVDISGNGFDATAVDTVVFGEPGVTNAPNPPLPPRYTTLNVTQAATPVAAFPVGFAQPDLTTRAYTFQVGVPNNTITPAGDSAVVGIPMLRLPAGYTIAADTLGLQPGDQWTNVIVWWDDDYSPDGAFVLTPYDYRSRLLLPR